MDSFYPMVDKCYHKYATISAFNIPEPNIVFQLGTSHTQTLHPIVAMQPEWAHLPAPPARIGFTNDDLAGANGTTFELTASTSDPTKVGINSSNLPHRVQVHTRQVSAYVLGR